MLLEAFHVRSEDIFQQYYKQLTTGLRRWHQVLFRQIVPTRNGRPGVLRSCRMCLHGAFYTKSD